METSLEPRLSDIGIRTELRAGDLGYIAHIHGELYALELGYGLNFEAYVLEGLNDFARGFDPDKDKVWICEHAGRIVGCLVAQHRTDAVQLRYFILLPEYRGMGLGKKLMGNFIAFMRSKNCRHAFLWTTNEQESAILLYTRYGFSLTEEKKTDHFDKHLTEKRYDLYIND